MDAGTLLWILLIGGGVFAMFFMHRGGHAGGGHDHGGISSNERQEPRDENEKVSLGKPGSHGNDHEPAVKGGKHRGC